MADGNDARKDILDVIDLLFDSSSSDSDEDDPIPPVFRRDVPRIKNFCDEIVPEMSVTDFQGHFRMKRSTVEFIAGQIAGKLPDSEVVDPVKKLLMTLWTLATLDSFRSISSRFGVSTSTLWESNRNIWTALAELSSSIIKFPSAVEMANVEAEFRRIAGFPGVIGCVDGTHIRIKAPKENQEVYVNRKGFHSFILQGIVNNQCSFIDCYVGEVGSLHDAKVYRRSKISREIHSKIPSCYHLLGDSAYPLSQTLLTPFRDNGHLSARQNIYNIKLSKTRNVVERVFGLLKGRFRRLLYLDMVRTDLAPSFIMACCVLHNICLNQDDFVDITFDDNEDEDLITESPDSNVNAAGVLKRQDIMNSF